MFYLHVLYIQYNYVNGAIYIVYTDYVSVSYNAVHDVCVCLHCIFDVYFNFCAIMHSIILGAHMHCTVSSVTIRFVQ